MKAILSVGLVLVLACSTLGQTPEQIAKRQAAFDATTTMTDKKSSADQLKQDSLCLLTDADYQRNEALNAPGGYNQTLFNAGESKKFNGQASHSTGNTNWNAAEDREPDVWLNYAAAEEAWALGDFSATTMGWYDQAIEDANYCKGYYAAAEAWYADAKLKFQDAVDYYYNSYNL